MVNTTVKLAQGRLNLSSQYSALDIRNKFIIQDSEFYTVVLRNKLLAL